MIPKKEKKILIQARVSRADIITLRKAKIDIPGYLRFIIADAARELREQKKPPISRGL